MARSFKKTKIFGNTFAESEKKDKRRWNKRFRRICKQLIHVKKEAPKDIRVLTCVWDGDKDGKHYWKNAERKDMRK